MSLAMLHATLQIVFGWSDVHLHYFPIHGKAYGCAADCWTNQEALANVQIIIQEWIESAKELGHPIPQRKGRLMYA